MTAQTVTETGPTASVSERSPGPSLSPSRAADFKTCPLLYRFRSIDRLPEQPSADQLRGTLVHAVLERLFDLPAGERTPDAAAALVAPAWESLLAREPELAAAFDAGTARSPGQAALAVDVPAPDGVAAFLASA